MSNGSEKTTEMQRKPEICTIRIMFPVNSDDEAITCKKKIQIALVDIQDLQIHFGIIPAPPTGSRG